MFVWANPANWRRIHRIWSTPTTSGLQMVVFLVWAYACLCVCVWAISHDLECYCACNLNHFHNLYCNCNHILYHTYYRYCNRSRYCNYRDGSRDEIVIAIVPVAIIETAVPIITASTKSFPTDNAFHHTWITYAWVVWLTVCRECESDRTRKHVTVLSVLFGSELFNHRWHTLL